MSSLVNRRSHDTERYYTYTILHVGARAWFVRLYGEIIPEL